MWHGYRRQQEIENIQPSNTVLARLLDKNSSTFLAAWMLLELPTN
ncbi:hypothetical protein [Chlorogloeopsis sp. ULAP02]